MRALWLRVLYPLHRHHVQRELEEEMALHVSLRTEQLEQDGMRRSEAVAEARRRFGNRSRLAGAARDAWGWQWLDGFGDDLHYVARQLRHSPGFTGVATLTIALAVALNATAFTFYDAIVLKPLPVAEPARVIRIMQDGRAFGADIVPFAAYDVLRRSARTVQSVVATTAPQTFAAVLPGHTPDDARIVSARFVSSDFFRVMGVRAASGRMLDATDDASVILDHGFWTRVLNADPAVVGRQLRVGDVLFTVAGIAPANFAGTGMPAVAPDVWLPLSAQRVVMGGSDWRSDGRAHWQLLGRMAEGVSLSQVAAELGSLARAIPDSAGRPSRLVPKLATFFQTDAGEFEVFQQVSVAFLVALALLLGIAVVNLVNLFAARNSAREREVTVRLALGATRARLARQLASESALVALLGGLVGLLLSHVTANWLRNWIVTTMSTITGGIVGVFLDISVDWRVIGYAIVLSLAIGLAAGLWPALRAIDGDVNAILRQGGTTTVGRGAWTKRNLLLATQVASSLVLLTAAAMLLTGMRLAHAIRPGFDAAHMLVVDVQDDAPDPARAITRNEIARRLSTLSDVRAVAWTQRVPFAGTHLRRVASAGAPISISIENVTETYFDVMGMPILRGRGFTRADVEAKAPVMILSESMARLRWPRGDAVGKSVPPNDPLTGPDTTKSYTVIGVVRDIRSNFLSRVNAASVYYPAGYEGPFGALLVRTREAPASAVNPVRLAVGGVSQVLMNRTRVLTMQDGPMALQRLMALVPAAIALGLAAAGLVLAAVGVYGLVAQVVTRRTREIGVHVAMGARPGQVVGLVLRKTLRPVAWGALVGALGAIALSVFLRSLIAMPDVPDLTFGAGAFNPLVFLGIVSVLSLMVIAACVVPVRRATAVDPIVALRTE